MAVFIFFFFTFDAHFCLSCQAAVEMFQNYMLTGKPIPFPLRLFLCVVSQPHLLGTEPPDHLSLNV